MSVNESDVYFYGSADMPDGDGVTTGGAVDFSKMVFFTDLNSNDTLDYVSSSSSDTATTLTSSGYDGSGLIQSETKTLNGTTKVVGTQTFAHLLKGVAGGTSSVGDIAALSHTAVISGHTAQGGANSSGSVAASIILQSGDGASAALGQIIRITNNTPAGVQFQLRRIIRISGDTVYVNKDWTTVPSSSTTYDINLGMLFDITPNHVTQIRKPFYNAAADAPGGATRTYYEKIFAVNNNTATTLTTAAILKIVDPSSGTFEFALCNALNDTGTVANRQTAPATGITAFTTGAAPQSINVPSPQNLPNGAAPNAAGAQGVWLSLALAAGSGAAYTLFDMRASGNTV